MTYPESRVTGSHGSHLMRDVTNSYVTRSHVIHLYGSWHTQSYVKLMVMFLILWGTWPNSYATHPYVIRLHGAWHTHSDSRHTVSSWETLMTYMHIYIHAYIRMRESRLIHEQVIPWVRESHVWHIYIYIHTWIRMSESRLIHEWSRHEFVRFTYDIYAYIYAYIYTYEGVTSHTWASHAMS